MGIKKRIFSVMLIIVLTFCSVIYCHSEDLNVVKSYYYLKYEYQSFIAPLLRGGATEADLILFFKDIEAELKKHENLTEETIDTPLKDALLNVATYRAHRNLSAIIMECYSEEMDEYFETEVIPGSLKDVYQAVVKSLFAKNAADKMPLVNLYEAYDKKISTDSFLYIASAVTAFNEALLSAKSVLQNRDATQAEIDDQLTKLSDAYKILENNKVPSTPSGNNTGSYTPGGYNAKDNDLPVVPIDKPVDSVDKSFYDVKESFWGYSAIIYLKEKNIIDGFPDGSFKPNDLVTREQFAKLICIAFNLQGNDQEVSYNDCSNDAWYMEYVKIITQNNIMQGIGDSNFGTGSNLIRQDMAVIANRILPADDTISDYEEFSDMNKVSDYAKKAVRSMKANGIIDGVGDNLFAPLETVTRAQAAQLIYSLIKNN